MEEKYNIADYVKGRMNPKDKALLEEELQTNKELAAAVDFYKEMQAFSDLKNKMDAFDAELQSESKIVEMKPRARKRKLGIRRVLSYAASLAVLLVTGGVWFANNNYSDQALSSKNVERLNWNTSNTSRQGESDYESSLKTGIEALQNKDYPTAIDFFKAIPESNTSWAQAKLNLAYALYQVEEYPTAQATLDEIIQKSTSVINRQKAEWLKLQVLLATGTSAEPFDDLLKNISENTQHLFQKQALDLQRELNAFWRKLTLLLVLDLGM